MSTTTTNYGLVKPDLTDPADITKMNLNWDTIDQLLAKLFSNFKVDSIEPVSELPDDAASHPNTLYLVKEV